MEQLIARGRSDTTLLGVLWEDGHRVVFKGLRSGPDGDARQVLVVLPAGENPSPADIDRLADEYELRDHLDAAWAVRPIELVHEHGRTMLVLADPEADPLYSKIGAPMGLARFLHLALPMAEALAGLHERGFIHKDVNPTTVLVNETSGASWLTGFGLASRMSNERSDISSTKPIVGSLPYIAPEQTGRMNRSVDTRSDLYSLGVTFYQMLTGSLPFVATDLIEWIHCHIARAPTPPHERLASVPEAVSQIVMKLLAKAPDDRYQTAAGLAHDLRHCRVELETQGRIGMFPLGRHDVSDRLQVPEKLYGRTREVANLLEAFDRVVDTGEPELVLVSGYSGTGKSAAVAELRKLPAPSSAIFVAGKFDQHMRDVPYAILAPAFQTPIREILATSDAELDAWRSSFSEALGPNGKLVADLLPELQLVIGPQPPLADLGPTDAKRRLHDVLRRFIGVLARREHPLVLFFDDLQWIDGASLDLLDELITRRDVKHLLLICTYRINGIDTFHPVTRKLSEFRRAGSKISQIELQSLDVEDLNEMVADTLHCEPSRTRPLAQLIHQKTGGNPFFSIQFLQNLADEHLMTFDHVASRWSWDVERILSKGYSDNVVDLMVLKLSRLPEACLDGLRQLACIGFSADHSLLATICEVAPEVLHENLREATESGLIVRLDNGSYAFVHDRIQEAVYSLIPESSRAAAHLRIGRLLLTDTPPERRSEMVFDIVGQFNGNLLPTVVRVDTRLHQMMIARIVTQSLKHGNSDASCCGYIWLGLALVSHHGEYAKSLRFGKLSLNLLESLGTNKFAARVYLNYGRISPWTEHVRSGRPFVKRAFDEAVGIGDLTFARYCCSISVIFALFAGEHLSEVEGAAAFGMDFVLRSDSGGAVDTLLGQRALMRQLRGLPQDLSFADGSEFVQDVFETRLVEGRAALDAFRYFVLKLQVCVLSGDFEGALQSAAKAQTVLWVSPGFIERAEYHFFAALAHLEMLKRSEGEFEASHREAVASHLAQLETWSKSCAENFESRVSLFVAEIANVEGRELEAQRNYERAIGSARENGFTQIEALALELASRSYFSRGFKDIADMYLLRARETYRRWGAEGKVLQLESRHPRLGVAHELGAKVGSVPGGQIDVAAFISASQVLSSEILLPRLIERLMSIALRNAGADRGLLILVDQGGYRIEVEARTGADHVVILSASATAIVPETIVRYVTRTQETVILDDARRRKRFADDPYFDLRRPLSVLCVPLVHHGTTSGVLYLENNLASYVFTPDRAVVLELLASQAAISLENTRLYGDLQERESRVRRLFNANVIGIFTWHVDGRITDANEAFLKIVGYSVEDFHSGAVRWKNLMPPGWDPDDDRLFDEMMESGVATPFEGQYVRMDGTPVPVLVGAAVFEGQRAEGVAFIVDLTDRKRAERLARESERQFHEIQLQLAHANRVATMGHLAASIAHELKQPLSGVVVSAETAALWLSEQPPSISEAQKSLTRVVRDGRRAGEVFDRIRSLIKNAPPQMTALDINEVVLDIIGLTRGAGLKNGVRIESRLAQDLPLVLGDRVQLQQVVLNLIMNAIDAINDADVDRTEIHVTTTLSPSGEVHVAVRDSGPGVDKGSLERIFAPFYTTKIEGLGMGLSICRSIIEGHGGKLWVTDALPQGAIFQFTVSADAQRRATHGHAGGEPEIASGPRSQP